MQTRPKAIFGVATTFGITAAVALMTPTAAFAAAPTFDATTVLTGFSKITLSGTADPNSKVQLFESAAAFVADHSNPKLAELEQAKPYQFPTSTTTGANGRWEIERYLDSGFFFAVQADGVWSEIERTPLRINADITAASTANGTVNFTVNADPDEPGLPVSIQRQSGGTWTTVASGNTDETSSTDPDSIYQVTVTGQPGGAQNYRVVMQSSSNAEYASPANLMLANTFAVPVTVQGTGGGSSPSPAPSSPSPSPTKPSPTPTKPTPTPTKPTTPPAPAAGSVQFTRVQYNAPGKDTRKNASLNGEYFKLTNKTKKTINLRGWSVRDRAGNLYRFSGNYYLGAGKSVVVRTGKGTNKSTVRYWGKTKHVWNNGGDTATLRTPANKTIDSCRWTKAGKGYTTC